MERKKLVLAALLKLWLQIVEFACKHGRVTIGDALMVAMAGMGYSFWLAQKKRGSCLPL